MRERLNELHIELKSLKELNYQQLKSKAKELGITKTQIKKEALYDKTRSAIEKAIQIESVNSSNTEKAREADKGRQDKRMKDKPWSKYPDYSQFEKVEVKFTCTSHSSVDFNGYQVEHIVVGELRMLPEPVAVYFCEKLHYSSYTRRK